MRIKLPMVALATLALLDGCTILGPDYQAPQPRLPAHFQAPPEAPDAPKLDLTHWWRSLQDPELDRLIELAQAANPDLAIAVTRLQIAEEQESQLLGVALPRAEAAAASGRGTGSDDTRGRVPSVLTSASNTSKTKTIGQLAGFDFAWEADLFGQYRRAIEAGNADIEAAKAGYDGVLITLIADVARGYLDYRSLQISLAVLQQNIQAARQARDFVKIRYERGLTNALDSTLAERELARLEAQSAPLEAARDAALSVIAALIGDSAASFGPSLTDIKPLPILPKSIDPGLPPEMLRRRPDLRQAERQLAAATARIGVAIGALFTRVSLAGAVGAQFPALGTGNGTHIWSFGPQAIWPLLDFGTIDAAVEIADINARGQLLAYRRAVINAVRDVDVALVAYRAQQERVAKLLYAVAEGEDALRLANERYSRGLSDYLNVADAERQLYALESDLVQAQQSAADAFVTLCKVLGGGWEDGPDLPAARRPDPAIIAMFARLAAPRRVETNSSPE